MEERMSHTVKIRTIRHSLGLLAKKIISNRTILIVISICFLLLLLVIPLSSIVVLGLSKGLDTFLGHINSPSTQFSIGLTVLVSLASVIASTLFGVFAAWCIVHFRFWGRRMLQSIIELPITISPIIVGFMFTLLYGKYGYLGNIIENTGITIIFSWPGLVLTNMAITLPYVARTLIPAMESLGADQERTARLLGANGVQIFFRITLPRIKWALLYGIILAMARGVGEYGAAAVVSGLVRNKTVTLPLQVDIYYSEYQSVAAFACATLFLFVSFITIVSKKLIDIQNSPAKRISKKIVGRIDESRITTYT